MRPLAGGPSLKFKEGLSDILKDLDSAFFLSGLFLGGVQVFAIVNLRTESAKNVGMRLTVRSTDMQISQFVAASVA